MPAFFPAAMMSLGDIDGGCLRMKSLAFPPFLRPRFLVVFLVAMGTVTTSKPPRSQADSEGHFALASMSREERSNGSVAETDRIRSS